MKNVIEVKNLVKKYDSLVAVDDISFKVKKGEIFGLLGENGAGKTTTLEIIEGLRKMNQGQVKILGQDIEKNLGGIKQKIGVQLQSSAYYDFLTLKEILELFASFYQQSRDPVKLLEMVGLEQKKDNFIGQLSGGQRQRFSIVASLINDPEIVFLDEPTTGLDPLARRNLWELINEIKKQGKTIILTTHYMEEAEQLSDRVAIMDRGKILVIGPPYRLIEQLDYPYRINFLDKNIDQNTLDQLAKFGQISRSSLDKDQYLLKIRKRSYINQALEIVQRAKAEDFVIEKASLEDLFIKLTGKRIED